jgi:hypothetical protein
VTEPLRLDEESNALDYLETTIRSLRRVDAGETIAWKWVVIAAHGAIYGFAVSAARGTNWHSVTYERKDGSRRLLGFDDVIKLCENPKHMKMLVHSKPLRLTDEQRKAIDFLKDQLRNEFQHFVPKGWVLFVEGLPMIAYRALEVIRFLALETGTFVHLGDQQQAEVVSLVEEGYEICERVRVRYKTE